MKIQFIQSYDHKVGNGTTVFYKQGDTDDFDAKLANALVYEGIGVAVPEEASGDEAEDRETKVTEPAETKPKKPKLDRK